MRYVVAIGVLAILSILGGLGFIYSGLYNVAATEPHSRFVFWALDTTKARSIREHAKGIEAPPLNDASLIHRGLRQFQVACVPCHGAPGMERGQIGHGINPEPPSLSESATRWTPAEIFWITKYGIRLAGMPAWGPTHRDDEIWALTAFVAQLPALDADAYASLTQTPSADGAVPSVVTFGGTDPAAVSCMLCHGIDGAGHESGAFPRLTGQNSEYLERALEDYAVGRRSSGLMEAISKALSQAERRAAAQHYAAATAERAMPRVVDGLQLQQGGAMSAIGAPDRGVPACTTCHGPAGTRTAPDIPMLAGQHADYLALQLTLWKDGVRTDQPMRDIAARLTAEEISAVAAYFAAARAID